MSKDDSYEYPGENATVTWKGGLCIHVGECGRAKGDLFVGGRERALRADFDIWGIIESLKRIARLDATVLFPGSARVRENPGPEIDRKIDYLEDLGGQILEQHRQGESVRQIVKALLGPPLLLEAITLGHYSRAALVRSYLRRSTTTAT